MERQKVGKTAKTTQFAEVALKAQEKVASHKMNPKEAWDEAAREIITRYSTRAKGCPKEAFLGLCSQGLVQGVPKGHYTDSEANKRYALKAVELLRYKPELGHDAGNELWDRVLKALNTTKVYNQQMHVVLALWTRGLIH